MTKKDTLEKFELTEKEKENVALYQPTDEEVAVLTDIRQKFTDAETVRNSNYEYFDGRKLKEYIEDSVRRFTTNIDEREDLEDWQARVNDGFTRNKVLAILGKVVSVLPIAQFTGRGDEDIRKGIILSNLYEYSEDVDDYEEFMTNYLLEAIVKGTAIGYENVDIKSRDIRNVKGSNDNITITKDVEKKTRLKASIVPLEDFYPSSLGIRRIKDMPWCFWRTEISYSEFVQNWDMYERSNLVQPHVVSYGSEQERPFYRDYVTNNTKEGNVEILRFYDREHDQYTIIANGVWLNPLKNKDTMIVSPLPWNHKELPFFDVRFDFFGADFFYGKSLPDRLKAMQDVLNVLTNMLLDQSFLTIFPPMLVAGFDDIEEDYMRPGRRIPIDTQGQPLSQSFMKLDPGTPSGWHQFILGYTRKVMEEASIDQVSSGNAGVGERTTAQEIRVAAEGVASTLGLFGRMINFGLKRKALMRGANILQFWTDPKNPVITQVMGAGSQKDVNKAFNTFKIGNAVLTNGKRGTKIIEMFADKKDIPNKKVQEARSQILTAEQNADVELDAVLPQYLRDFSHDIKLVLNPKSEGSKEVEKALQLEKVRVYLSFFPEMVDKTELLAQTAEKMGDDPTKIMKPEILEEAINPENKEAETPLGQDPTQNTANNIARSAKGGEGAADLGQMAASLQG